MTEQVYTYYKYQNRSTILAFGMYPSFFFVGQEIIWGLFSPYIKYTLEFYSNHMLFNKYLKRSKIRFQV